MLSTISASRAADHQRADTLIAIRGLAAEIRAMETRAYELRIQTSWDTDPFVANFFLVPLLKQLERNKSRMTELCGKIDRLCDTCMLASYAEVYSCRRHAS